MNSKNIIQKLFCGDGFVYGPMLSDSEISIIREFIQHFMSIYNIICFYTTIYEFIQKYMSLYNNI